MSIVFGLTRLALIIIMVSAVLCVGYFSLRKVTPQQSEIEVISFDYDAVHTGNPSYIVYENLYKTAYPISEDIYCQG